MASKVEWLDAFKHERTTSEKQDVYDGETLVKPSGLTSETKAVLAYLYLYANEGAGLCAWPTITHLAEVTGKQRTTIRKHLERAAMLGWLRAETYGYEENPLSRWYFTIPEQLHPARKTGRRLSVADQQVTTTGQHVTTGEQPMTSGGHSVTTTGQQVTTEAKREAKEESKEKRKEAAATHTREGERAHEASQPAAAKGQDLNLDHEQQTANKPAVDASHDEASPELVQMLGTLLASRMASLVRKPDAVTPAMIRPALRTLKRWAAGDEGKVKEYLFDELDRQEGRDAHERAAHPGVLLKWLADKKSWNKWQAAAASATPAAPNYGPNRDKSIPVGRPPRPGMKWNSVIGDWTNSCAIHTGLLANLPGSDADDEVQR